MGDIDYSKQDFVDINNRLFRLGRNKINENSKGIKDLDDDNKSKGEKNLLVYGSELINNLNQINYTFKQLEDYIFVPITKGKTKKDIKKIIDKGYSGSVDELKEPTSTLESAFSALDSDDIIPDLEIPEMPPYQHYKFVDNMNYLSYDELTAQLPIVTDEIGRIYEVILNEIDSEGITLPLGGLTDDIIDKIFKTKLTTLKEMINYLFGLRTEQRNIMDSINYEEKALEEAPETIEEAPVKKRTKQQILEDITEQTKDKPFTEGMLESAAATPLDEEAEEPVKTFEKIKFPEPGKDLTTLKEILETKKVENKTVYLQNELKNLGFTGAISTLSQKAIKNLIDVYESKTGSGRYKGGVGKKGMKKGMKKGVTTPVTPVTPGAPSISPSVVDEDEDSEDETDPADEVKKNDVVAKALDKSMKDAANIPQKSPIPGYITKIYELMTNLVQFIGRTNVLYISRIKKNLNYLDEDQVKLIYEAISKFKNNLRILKDFNNKGNALIKDTLYNQVEKETINLYNEIYNSIRNYSKMKDYTILAGSGMRNYYMDPMYGGYFIQSDDPFIRHSTTKRFL